MHYRNQYFSSGFKIYSLKNFLIYILSDCNSSYDAIFFFFFSGIFFGCERHYLTRRNFGLTVNLFPSLALYSPKEFEPDPKIVLALLFSLQLVESFFVKSRRFPLYFCYP